MSDRRRSRHRQLDASHQRSWLTGRYAVSEMLVAGVWPARRLCVTSEGREQLPEGIADSELEAEVVTSDRLTELCGSRHHQGMAAQMGAYPYQGLAELASLLHGDSAEHSLPPLVVVCDRLQDGHNFGAILRSCDAMAATAVVIGEREQVGVTPQVARASAGAVSHVPIVRVEDLAEAIGVVQQAGCQVLAASEKSSCVAREVNASVPTALVVGSEAHGVSEALMASCDQQVRIPMLGRVGSLNAAVAAGMLLYELRRGVDLPQ